MTEFVPHLNVFITLFGEFILFLALLTQFVISFIHMVLLFFAEIFLCIMYIFICSVRTSNKIHLHYLRCSMSYLHAHYAKPVATNAVYELVVEPQD